MTGNSLSIAIVTGSVSRKAGGLFHSVRQLALGLHDAGARVGVFGLWDADSAKDLAAWAPLEPHVFKPVPTQGIGFARGLHNALTSFQPTLIHQHGIWQGYSRTVANWANTVPTVISPRGMLDPWAIQNSSIKKKLAWNAWEDKNLRSAACLHALAANEATAIKAVLPDARIEIIPNAVLMPPPPDQPVQTKTKKTLLFLGRIHPKKGLAELVVQWENLPKSTQQNWQVVIAGPDENGHRAELQAAIATKNLSDYFQFVGPAVGPDKARLFANADAFILPSHSEGLPMAVLEAWATGTPVFMTQACNLPEGFAANAALEVDHDPRGHLLQTALDHPDLKSIGENGRALAQSTFALPNIIRAHLANYERLVAARAA